MPTFPLIVAHVWNVEKNACCMQLGTVPTHNASFLWAVCIVSVSSDREMKLTSMDCGMVFIERVVEIENFLSFVLA